MARLTDSRKGAAGVLLLALIVAIIIYGIVTVSQRECSRDSHCKEGYYCGSDFKCHQHKTYEVNNNFLAPSIILGIAIIIAALIIKDKLPSFTRK
ncbi:hypothetical protein D6745_05405 [Candidatus Woesearchaeota archaeon]|nr:MAG: hypothetical protein D6745_05405 [Candidatus Woesearchaeota archaeon]